jgi:hypothetical protein
MRKPLLVFGATALVLVVIVGIAARHNVHSLIGHFRAKSSVVATVSSAAYDRAQFINKFYHATVLMYLPTEEGGEKMQCTATAFQVVTDGNLPVGYLFASASHCVDGKKSVDLTRDEFQDGGKKVFYHATVVAQSDRTTGVDAAVLYVGTTDHFDLIPVGKNPVQLGEAILNLSGPQGAPKQIFMGAVSSLYLNRPVVLDDDGSDWEGFFLIMVPGEGPGSSGSMLVCEAQHAACGLTVGHMPGGIVALPIERFTAWWDAVGKHKISPFPATGTTASSGVGVAGKKPPIGKPLQY